MNSETGDQDTTYPPICDIPNEGPLKTRLDNLSAKFVSHFHETPEVFLRVPGRVNLIGEHVDYCGYSVCPMAIQQDILIAAKISTNGNFLEIINFDQLFDSSFVFPDSNFEINLKTNGWVSYFLCGVKGVLEKLGSHKAVHMQVLVTGNIPPGAGLSSSSALVSASYLLTSYLNKMRLTKRELAALSADSEQYIGTVGGGMDQAIAFLASRGCAKHIEFAPVRTQDVPLPEGAVFVIANSMVRKNKAESSDYNCRVIECRLATQILAKKYGKNWKEMKRLVDIHTALDLPLIRMLELVEETFHDWPYTKKEVCEQLGVDEKELDELSLTPNTRDIKQFKIKQRALHVFQEARRVALWCKGCREGWELTSLGELMTQSHRSLRDLYECSHPSLDSLVKVCLASGALGARLTGAGWGGCVVALTTTSHVKSFIESVKKSFYNPEQKDIDELIFATEPDSGAQIFTDVYQI